LSYYEDLFGMDTLFLIKDLSFHDYLDYEILYAKNDSENVESRFDY
jgi:hypothetical protein